MTLVTHRFQPGDRVDYAAHSGALVVHVGLGTLTLEAVLPAGPAAGTLHRLNAPVSACRRHIAHDRITLGAFTLRQVAVGQIWLQHRSGEGGSFDESAMESLLEKFWRRHF